MVGSRTALQLVNDAQLELGLFPLATSVFGASDDSTLQMQGLLQRVGDTLLNMRQWTSLQTEAIIQLAAPTVTTGNFTINSAVVTAIPSTAALTASIMAISGSQVQQAARIKTVDSISQITMTEVATATKVGGAVTFSQDTFPIPVDFSELINDTLWDRSRKWRIMGPLSPQQDQWLHSGTIATGPRRSWRSVGRSPSTGYFRIFPSPSTSDTPATISYEYLSSYWATTTGGTAIPRLAADTDTCVFDDDLMVLGLKALYWQIKGFDWQPHFQLWQEVASARMARDGGRTALDMASRYRPILISSANVPDTGFGN